VLKLITYRNCNEVSIDSIYEAFTKGFSDYIINISLPKEEFVRRFFGPEGNTLENSIIAYDGEKPVGLNLGGIKIYEGIKTLRCGALCIHPDYRGTEVGKILFNMHKEIANENSCKQMFLEVIVGNDRAINFYNKRHYGKVYDLSYYTHTNPSSIIGKLPEDIVINRNNMEDIITLNDRISDIHINWQNNFDYICHIDTIINYGLYDNSNLIGGACINPTGKIHFLWIDPKYRGRGIGSGIIDFAVNDLNLDKLHISFPNNAILLGFINKLGFAKDSISQYEMYLTLK